MAPLFASVATRGSVVTSDRFRADRTLWRIKARTGIDGDVTACKETTLLETAVGIGVVAGPQAMISSTTWSTNKMAGMFRRGKKWTFQYKIHSRRDTMC